MHADEPRTRPLLSLSPGRRGEGEVGRIGPARGAAGSRLRCVALFAASLLWPRAAGAAAIGDPLLEREGEGLKLSLRLENGFTPEIQERILSGLEVPFEYTVRLRRKRGGLTDKSVSERFVLVTVQYSNLTKMYTLTRSIDGTVIDADVTERAEAMRSWMAEFKGLKLFDARDIEERGRYYVRVKAKLLGRSKMLFIPWDLETPWIESGPVIIEEAR